MKIGAFVPQGWRLDLNDMDPITEWETILNSAIKLGYNFFLLKKVGILFQN